MPGYEICKENLKTLNKKYLCTSCMNVLKDPVQTKCGHLYCKTCVQGIKEQKGARNTCLIDDQSLEETFEDKCAKREILSMTVACANSKDGCVWTGELRDLESHQESCPWKIIECDQNGCSAQVRRRDLEEHRKNSCSYKVVNCQHCEGSVVFKNLEIHKEMCPKLPVNCEKCGKTGITRQKLSQHLDPHYLDCEQVEGFCPFKEFGCGHEKKMKKKERRSHIAENSAFHLTLLLAFVQQVSDMVGSATKEAQVYRHNRSLLSSLEESLSASFIKIESIIKENVDLRDKLDRHHERILKLESIGSRQRYSGDDVESDCGQFGGLQSSNQRQSNSSEITRRLNNLEGKTANHEMLLVEANQAQEEQRARISFLERQLEMSKETVRRLERRVESQDHMIALRNVALADLEDYVRQQDVSSYDGTLLWKITNFSRRRNDAVNGRETSFYSPCFYTSRHGYKMAARIYLNGDGMGKGTHISLFFVVMRGQYDALLRWPFRQKVTMMILDQGNVEHEIDAFRPDPNSSSFKRPTREMNVASGAPLFFPLADLEKHAYVKDGTMFVKFIVDTTDLP